MKHIDIKMICLVFLLAAAVKEDFKSYKIPNYLILTGYFISFLFLLMNIGWAKALFWVVSIIIPILVLFPLFLIKALGAGDIKLLSVIGSFYGITYVLKSIVATFIVAGVLSVIHLLRFGQASSRLEFLKKYICKLFNRLYFHVNEGEKGIESYQYYKKNKDGYKGVIHFSLAILIALLLQSVFHIY